MATEFLYNQGDEYKFERYISAQDVKKFAEIVGDLNPIHLDVEFAERSFFKQRIVHGAFLAGLISKVLGMDFPGQGTVYIRGYSSISGSESDAGAHRESPPGFGYQYFEFRWQSVSCGLGNCLVARVRSN
jgi:acyl dehydratase